MKEVSILLSNLFPFPKPILFPFHHRSIIKFHPLPSIFVNFQMSGWRRRHIWNHIARGIGVLRALNRSSRPRRGRLLNEFRGQICFLSSKWGIVFSMQQQYFDFVWRAIFDLELGNIFGEQQVDNRGGVLIELAAAELSVLFWGHGELVCNWGYRVKYGGSLYNLCYLLQALHLLRPSFFFREIVEVISTVEVVGVVHIAAVASSPRGQSLSIIER